jgi:hypothetical protein
VRCAVRASRRARSPNSPVELFCCRDGIVTRQRTACVL